MLEIRDHHQEDAPQLSRLVQEAYSQHAFDGVNPEVDHESRVFVAEDDGQVVGFALIETVDYGMGPRHANLYEVVVDPAHQRRGIATSLIDQCVNWLREREVPIVYLNGRDDGARRLYERLGFQPGHNTEMYRVIEPGAHTPGEDDPTPPPSGQAAPQVWA